MAQVAQKASASGKRVPKTEPTIGGSTYVRPQDLEWSKTQFDKVWIKTLYEDRFKGESTVLKFDRDGNFIKTFGRKGKGPGEFDLPHSLVFDAKGLLYIADRNNARIQVFDVDGRFVRESRHPGTPCGLCAGPDGFLYLAHGHTGLVKKLDWQGNVLGETGGQGKTLGRFGEAHYIAVSGRGEVFVTDTLNWRVQKYVKR